MCTPTCIWGKWSEAAYKCRATREGGTFRERKRVGVSFTVCGVTVTASSLKGLVERQHGRSAPQKREVEIGGGGGGGYLCGFLPPGTEDD